MFLPSLDELLFGNPRAQWCALSLKEKWHRRNVEQDESNKRRAESWALRFKLQGGK